MKQTGALEAIQVWKKQNGIKQPSVVDKSIIDIIDDIAALFSAGSYYYFIFNFNTLTFELIKGDLDNVLGITPEILDLDYLFSIFHPDDLVRYHEKEKVGFDFLLNHIPTEDIPLYKVVYLMRLRHTDGSYKTILHQSKTINVSKDGKVQQVICTHTDLTHQNIPMDHNISFISKDRPSYYAITTSYPHTFRKNTLKNTFTPREYDIIYALLKGKSVKDIAELLSLSVHTVNTHKKNILKKSNCKNTADLITTCLREGVI